MTFSQVNLAEVAELELGKSPPRESVTPIGTGMPLLAKPSELGERTPRPEAATTKPERVARSGDLIVSVRGAKLGIANVADRDYAVGRGAAIVRPLDRSTSDFLYLALGAVRKQLERLAATSAVPTVNLEALSSLMIAWADSPERKRIVERVELVRSYAASTRGYADRFEEAGEVAYALLVDQLGTLPAVPLGDLVVEIRDRIAPEEVTTMSVTHYTHDQVRRGADPEVVAGRTLRSPRKRIPEGSLLLSLIHPARWTAGRAELRHDYLALGSPEFLVMDVTDDEMAAYLHAVLRFDRSFREQIQALAHSGTPGRERTRPKEALRLAVPVPGSAELREFSRRWRDWFELEEVSTRRAVDARGIVDPTRDLLLVGEAA